MQQLIIEPDLHLPHLTEHHRLFNALPVIILNNHDYRISGTHWHDYLQIFYTCSGTYRHTVDGVEHLSSAGTVILDFPYLPHRIDTSISNIEELKIIQISVRKDMWRKYHIPFLPITYNSATYDGRLLPSITTVTGEEKTRLDHLCADLVEEYDKQSHMQANRLMSLIGCFLQTLTKDTTPTLSSRELQSIAARNAAFDYVMDHTKQNIVTGTTLNEASRLAGMSRSSFAAGFRAVTGKTFHDYQNQLRMLKATNQLLKAPSSIAEIAKDCGYYDSSHFRLQCTAMFGIPPHELRLLLSEYTRVSNTRFVETMEKMRWTKTFDEEAMQRHQQAMSFY